MTTQEFALKYEVPMPETCQKLDWKKETLFYWIKHKDWKEWHIKFYKEIQITLLEYKGEYKVLPAPNAQELFEALPEMVVYENKSLYFKLGKHTIQYYTPFDRDFSDLDIWILSTESLAEGLAKMYNVLVFVGLSEQLEKHMENTKQQPR